MQGKGFLKHDTSVTQGKVTKVFSISMKYKSLFDCYPFIPLMLSYSI